MSSCTHYATIEKAIHYLVDHYQSQPSLDEVAAHVGMSKYHFQRLFSAWVGVSPKQFVDHLTVQALKEELLRTSSILEASDQVGLSSQSRGYDLMVKIEAVTPGEFKSHGQDVEIRYGCAPTPFGEALVATTSRGVCAFEFVDEDAEIILAAIRESWYQARFVHDEGEAQRICAQIFERDNEVELPVLLKGTPFQIKVWSALLSIPSGVVASYSSLADMMGLSSSVRAVASAVAKNPIGYIIPCHRVIRSTGIINNYRWRSERKALMLGWEHAQKCPS